MKIVGIVASAFSIMLLVRPAVATSEQLFGFGPRDTALAQSDIADGRAATAAWVNPALLTASGVRVVAGYSHGRTALTLNGEDSGVRDIAGTQLALQIGGKLGENVALGAGLAMHLPNRSLARIAFSPGTEPSFVRFEPASQSMSIDAAAALRWGWFSVGVGASMLISANGQLDLNMKQDARGAFADGNADVVVPFNSAMLIGLAADFGRAAGMAFRYRGAQAITLDFATAAMIDVQGNPLNGVTKVHIEGSSGYVPSTWDIAVRCSPTTGMRFMGALQLATWSAAPGPAANLSMDVELGLTPGLREGLFVRPNYRDTLSPRVGFEVSPGGEDSDVELRLGYAFVPSPVSQPRGFASPVDASTHTIAAGAGVDLGKNWGVDLRVDAAVQWMMLNRRQFDKGRDAMPFARYEADGFIAVGSVAVEGAWQ